MGMTYRSTNAPIDSENRGYQKFSSEANMEEEAWLDFIIKFTLSCLPSRYVSVSYWKRRETWKIRRKHLRRGRGLFFENLPNSSSHQHQNPNLNILLSDFVITYFINEDAQEIFHGYPGVAVKTFHASPGVAEKTFHSSQLVYITKPNFHSYSVI